MPSLLMSDLSTSTMRLLWADHFKRGYSSLRTFLGREGVKTYDFTFDAWHALELALQANGYGNALIVSTYYPRLIAGTNVQSLHGYSGVALDVDPGLNPFIRRRPFSWNDTRFTPEQVEAVKAIRTNSGAQVWRWGGDSFGVNSQDYMHWQLNCSPSDIESGIDWSTVDGHEEHEEMWLSLDFWQRMRAIGGLLPGDDPSYFTKEGDANGARATSDEVSHALASCFERLAGGGIEAPADLVRRVDEVEVFVDVLGDKVGGVIATLRSVG